MPKFKVSYWQYEKFEVIVEAEDEQDAIYAAMNDSSEAVEVPYTVETDDYVVEEKIDA